MNDMIKKNRQEVKFGERQLRDVSVAKVEGN